MKLNFGKMDYLFNIPNVPNLPVFGVRLESIDIEGGYKVSNLYRKRATLGHLGHIHILFYNFFFSN